MKLHLPFPHSNQGIEYSHATLVYSIQHVLAQTQGNAAEQW